MALRWVISGLVQGVGFRWYVKRRADQLGLTGWVKNLPNGQVEVVAEGPDDSLAAMEELLRKGPPAARVARVEKSQISAEVLTDKSFLIK